MTRRVLVISPFFPPSGLPPSHRARLFVRHLRSYGWEPIVLTVDPRDREEAQEPALVSLVPPDIQIESVRAFRVALSRRLGFGDLGLRALPALLARAVRIVRAQRADVILLIVPPWYALLMTRALHWLTGKPIVVDYVDPWRIEPTGTLKSRLAARVAAWSESWCLTGVSGLFAVSQAIVAEVQRRFPAVANVPSGSAPYGFDAADLTLAGKPTAGDGTLRRIVYVGALSDSQLPVFTSFLDALAATPLPIRLELYGTTYAPGARARPRVAHLVEARGLSSQVIERPERVPYAEAMALAAGADANLVLGDLTTYYAASKLMPTLAARRPIVAVLHAATEPAALLRGLNAKGLVLYGDQPSPTPADAVPSIRAVLSDLVAGRISPLTIDVMTDLTLRPRTAAGMTGALADVLTRVVDQ
ncbi:MAG TPA: glycosyltransferase [Gemmatimonadaceae bacterium]|nr:glycosyltransferase [Gemmatimonadaceae bacterium]